ncbi:MAG: ATP-binding cassette domain-containing protein [Saprospiraceae bacterium]|nr:ATP-binding cassette domain-containing protein [Saprospiraceae bacterium]
MIQLESVGKRYGDVWAVSDLSLRIPEGQTLALIGTSGCGKTTTLKMINRLIEPSTGRIRVEGLTDTDPIQLRRHMGYVIQDMGLFPHYTAVDNASVVPGLLGWERDRIRRRVAYLFDQLGLPVDRFGAKYPHQLSGGQQQRIGIARALAADPPIILMDEPFGALDPITRREIRADFMELEELVNKTTVIVTHDVEEAFDMADQICLLDAGRVQQTGTPRELLLSPANSFVEQFLAGQRTQLELKVIELGELIDYLPEAQKEAGDDQVELKESDTVALAVEKLQASPGRSMIGRMQDRAFKLPELMRAFYKAVSS